MSIRDYWHLPPDQQAAIRTQVLGDPVAAAPVAQRESSLAHGYKVIYARDLIANLGGENVEQRSDAEVIECAEILGFHWTGTSWVPD